MLWDDKILNHLLHSTDKLTVKSRKLLHKLELPRGASSVKKGSKFSRNADSKWLSKAQDLMLDFSTQKALSQAVGKLYSLCTESSKTSDGKIDIYNEDAVSYARCVRCIIMKRDAAASLKFMCHLCVSNHHPFYLHRAFKDALDNIKHGGKIILPQHLHENLPPSLQVFLKSK